MRHDNHTGVQTRAMSEQNGMLSSQTTGGSSTPEPQPQ